jgi:hypothetical protein
MVTQPCSDWQCSLERLDDNKGYTIDNIALICLEFNNDAKWNLDKINQILTLADKHYDDILLLHEIDDNLNKPDRRGGRGNPIVSNKKGKVKCNKCNTFKSKTEFNKYIGNGCKDCKKKYTKEYKSTIKGHLHQLVSCAKNNTNIRNSKSDRSADDTFNITYADLVILLRNQHGKCAYSGIKLNYGPSREKDWVASLERIDSKRGYEKNNICLVCAEFNGIDHSAVAKYSNGGSGGWSKEKFNFFLETISNNIKSGSNIEELTSDPHTQSYPGKYLKLNILLS